MGTYVDAYVFDIVKLKDTLEKHYDRCAGILEGKMRPGPFLNIVMPEYGKVVGGYFVVISNDHAEEFNAWYGFEGILSRYYGKDPDSDWRELFDLFKFSDEELGKVKVDGYGPDWKDEREWAELGIVGMPDEWDE